MLLIVAFDMSSPFTPMGVPPKTAGNWAAAYSEGFAVLKLMKPGKF
jgi:hypothetical protein